MRTLLLGALAAVLAIAGCGKGDQPKPLGAVGNNQADNGSQSGSGSAPGAGATGLGSTGEGGGGVGPVRTSGGNPGGSD
ncbi:MAG TPA: hypothetical protein VIK18_15455 [Pirellulales bacterium]